MGLREDAPRNNENSSVAITINVEVRNGSIKYEAGCTKR
jgi:hypothetical protein